MAGFHSIKEIVDAEEEGRHLYSWFSKSVLVGAQSTSVLWSDWTFGAGIPETQKYVGVPLKAMLLDGNTGIYCGQPVSPSTKFLKKIWMQNTASTFAEVILCDYLLYYPFITLDMVTPALRQVCDNTVGLTRFTSGEGVKLMMVCQMLGGGGSGSMVLTIEYVDGTGVSLTDTIYVGSGYPQYDGQVVPSSFSTGQTNFVTPWVNLSSIHGIRSVTAVTTVYGSGGYVALVLVKPVASFTAIDNTELDFVSAKTSMPKIEDGAYLSFISSTPPSNRALSGCAEFIWS